MFLQLPLLLFLCRLSLLRLPQETFDQLLSRLAEADQQLKEQHAAKKKELAALYKKERGLIQKKIRIVHNRERAADRKKRTRRLILMGSYMEHITANDEAAKDRLMKGLDGFLERDRDRALFDLPPK